MRFIKFRWALSHWLDKLSRRVQPKLRLELLPNTKPPLAKLLSKPGKPLAQSDIKWFTASWDRKLVEDQFGQLWVLIGTTKPPNIDAPAPHE